jgi:hypothetical protein
MSDVNVTVSIIPLSINKYSNQKVEISWALVAHTCNPSYFGG